MNRRALIAAFAAMPFALRPALASGDGTFEFTLTEEEWRARLSPEAYAVLREEDTERPFTSPLNDEKREGVFACAGCDLPLFDSATKYDSGTGWPSFYAPIDDAIRTRPDVGIFGTRTEVHCRRCGGSTNPSRREQSHSRLNAL